MVQNIGNTRQADFDNLLDAVEKDRTYEPEERIRVEIISQPELQSPLSGVWH